MTARVHRGFLAVLSAMTLAVAAWFFLAEPIVTSHSPTVGNGTEKTGLKWLIAVRPRAQVMPWCLIVVAIA